LSGRRCPDCARLSGAEKHTKWTKEEVYKEASKYETLTDFQKQAIGAYVSATRNGWMDDLRKNFKILKKNWSKEEIQEIANNYLARGKFCLQGEKVGMKILLNIWNQSVINITGRFMFLNFQIIVHMLD
jgi:hypothetical protein